MAQVSQALAQVLLRRIGNDARVLRSARVQPPVLRHRS